MLCQLSSQDAQFLYMETRHNLTHVTFVTIFDPSTVEGGKTVRYKDIVRHIESRLKAHPFTKRKLMRVPMELDYPYWIEDEYFDINSHMRHVRLPKPGDWRQLCIYVADYHSRPLDMERPLWEMEVIEGVDNVEGLPKGCYAIATKLHHCTQDGAQMMKFSVSMGDKDNKGTPALPIVDRRDEYAETPSVSEMLSRAAFNNATSPIRLINSVLRASPGLYKTAELALKGGEKSHNKSAVPKTRFDKGVSPQKVFDGTYIDMQSLQDIRSAVQGATVNDVVLAICGGALRDYLLRHEDLPEESLVAWVPINARPGGAKDAGAEGNNISATTVPVFTQQNDPLERLRAIHRVTSVRKKKSSGGTAKMLTDISKHMPSMPQAIASQLVARSGLVARQCNLFVSNVPGPSETLYMNGAKAVNNFGMAPLADGLGLFIATPSYSGKMGFLVTSTMEILPDIRFFVECIDASYAALKKATTKPRRRSRTKKAVKN